MTNDQLETIIQRLTHNPNHRAAYLLGGCAIFAFALSRFLYKRAVPHHLLDINGSGHWMVKALDATWDITGSRTGWSLRLQSAGAYWIRTDKYGRRPYKMAKDCFFKPTLRIVRVHTLCLELAEAGQRVPMAEAITEMFQNQQYSARQLASYLHESEV